jgi:hypothetical protein
MSVDIIHEGEVIHIIDEVPITIQMCMDIREELVGIPASKLFDLKKFLNCDECNLNECIGCNHIKGLEEVLSGVPINSKVLFDLIEDQNFIKKGASLDDETFKILELYMTPREKVLMHLGFKSKLNNIF